MTDPLDDLPYARGNTYYTVYEHPLDYPTGWVIRGWDIVAEGEVILDAARLQPEALLVTEDEEQLQRARRLLEERGYYLIPRSSCDVLALRETWI